MKPAKVYDADAARADLSWLAVVRGVTAWAERGDGTFEVTMPDKRTHQLDVGQVQALRTGVLVGFRLPRSAGVL